MSERMGTLCRQPDSLLTLTHEFAFPLEVATVRFFSLLFMVFRASQSPVLAELPAI